MAVLGQSPDRHLIYNCAPPTVAKAGCLGKKITAGGACTASPLHHLYLKLSRSDVFVFSNTNIFSSLSLSCLPLNSCQLLPSTRLCSRMFTFCVCGRKQTKPKTLLFKIHWLHSCLLWKRQGPFDCHAAFLYPFSVISSK